MIVAIPVFSLRFLFWNEKLTVIERFCQVFKELVDYLMKSFTRVFP